jgi:hypothetical protein
MAGAWTAGSLLDEYDGPAVAVHTRSLREHSHFHTHASQKILHAMCVDSRCWELDSILRSVSVQLALDIAFFSLRIASIHTAVYATSICGTNVCK